jgi:hypothetical protein
MMNTIERTFPPSSQAEVRYHHGEFKIVRHGTHVRCAATGLPIALDDLKYWSVERQEAYSSPEAVLTCLRAAKSANVYGQ